MTMRHAVQYFEFVRRHWALVASGLFIAVLFIFSLTAIANPVLWKLQWPDTDFSRHSVDLGEIKSGGVGKDGIPAIDKPKFVPVEEMVKTKWIPGTEPVIAIGINGDMRAYPLRILTWHEIVNDTVGGVPITVTYCPLCNSAVVFDRRLDGRVLDFGVSGNLRKSDMVMYDRQTESWWQQFLGEAIVGELTGKQLKMLPARVESFARFAKRAPAGKVLVPTGDVNRPDGSNPYRGYDSSGRPFLYQGEFPKGIAPLAYVLVVGKKAWALDLIRKRKRIEDGDLVITWAPGQNSALDRGTIAESRDLGDITVQRRTKDGLVDAVHDLTFAFVAHAFVPDVKIQR